MIDIPLGNSIPLEISTYFNLENRLDAALLSTVRKGNRELDLSLG